MSGAQHTPGPMARVGEDAAFFLRKQPDGTRWPVGTDLYAAPDVAALVSQRYEVARALSDLLRELRAVGGRLPDGFDWRTVSNAENALAAIAKATGSAA